MKYLITESQLEKVIFRYLNIQNFYVTNNDGDYHFWNNYNIENREIIISTFKQTYCFIKKDFVKTISSFFSLDRGETMNIIGDWVESKTGFEFKNLLIID